MLASTDRELDRVSDRVCVELCDTAVWDGPHCTWLGWQQPIESVSQAPSDTPDEVFGTLSPSLYEGTAGVALALALLADEHHPERAQTAVAAADHALARIAELPDTLPLYAGRLGVITAAAITAARLDNVSLAARAGSAASSVESLTGTATSDLVGGSAGAIPAFLVLAKLGVDPTGREKALCVAQELVAAGVPARGGLSWRGIEADRPPLTGVAHGAAGIGACLLCAYREFRDPHFRAAGEAAFAYEDSFLTAEATSWPDLRLRRAQNGRGQEAWLRDPRYGWSPDLWCHGAPGIALTRAFGDRLTHNTDMRRAAQRGAQAALRALERAKTALQSSEPVDASLCHGVSGLVHIVEQVDLGREATKRSRGILAALLRSAGSLATTASVACGTPSGAFTPSFMLGSAGVALVCSGITSGSLCARFPYLAPWEWPFVNTISVRER
ncbi:MAG: lanthionine synthetase LanC family protein [Solirubrobacteraceae bacterium]